jgi:hypothetical protein
MAAPLSYVPDQARVGRIPASVLRLRSTLLMIATACGSEVVPPVLPGTLPPPCALTSETFVVDRMHLPLISTPVGFETMARSSGSTVSHCRSSSSTEETSTATSEQAFHRNSPRRSTTTGIDDSVGIGRGRSRPRGLAIPRAGGEGLEVRAAVGCHVSGGVVASCPLPFGAKDFDPSRHAFVDVPYTL